MSVLILSKLFRFGSFSHILMASFFVRIVQGWSSVIPKFSIVDFASFYVELPVMLCMYLVWLFLKRQTSVSLPGHSEAVEQPIRQRTLTDLVDINDIDLKMYEYVEGVEDIEDDERRELRLKGRWSWLWRIWYILA